MRRCKAVRETFNQRQRDHRGWFCLHTFKIFLFVSLLVYLVASAFQGTFTVRYVFSILYYGRNGFLILLRIIIGPAQLAVGNAFKSPPEGFNSSIRGPFRRAH